MVGRPDINLVDENTGKAEFNAIKASKNETKDLLFLTDGRIVECDITGEDDINIFINIKRDSKLIKTQMPKVQIKEVVKLRDDA